MCDIGPWIALGSGQLVNVGEDGEQQLTAMSRIDIGSWIFSQAIGRRKTLLKVKSN